MSDVFRLSRRKGTTKWQVRKRWPGDVAAVLRGEFNVSTGEEDRKLAQERLPLIAAEYERRVREARDKLAAAPREELSQAESHRMALQFFQASLPRFVVRRQLDQLAQRELLADARQRVAVLRGQLGRNEYGPVGAVARTMLRQAGLEVSDEAPSVEYLRRMLMRAFVELHEAAVAHLSGEAAYVPSDVAMREGPEADPEKPERTVDALLTAYEKDKTERWSGSSKKAVVPVFRLLRHAFPNRDVSTITRDDARAVVELVRGLPTILGKRKELQGLTVPQAVEEGRRRGLPTIAPKTANDGYLIHITGVFNWARKEQWISSNPFEGLAIHDPVADQDRRDPFTADQLKALFASAPWDRPLPADDAKPGAYWVPLLCLLHGLRLGEAAGLRVEDVGEEDGTPVLRVVGYGEKRLKNAEARGTLALHPELLRLGFLNFVERRKAAKETLLFPEGRVNGRGQVAAKLGERFSARLKQAGFVGRKLGMHSFRHNFEDRLREAELPQRTALALARRAEPGSSGGYGKGVSVRLKAEAIAKVTHPGLDLSHLYVGVEEQTDA